MRPIEDYFAPYGTLGKLRGGNLRSFFERVKSPFDLPDPDRTREALSPFVDSNGRYECAYCASQAEEWDHIDEAAAGGSHQLGNLLPACRSCNRRKRPWIDQLRKVSSGAELNSRRDRIERYMKYLVSPGYRLFDKQTLSALEAAEGDLAGSSLKCNT